MRSADGLTSGTTDGRQASGERRVPRITDQLQWQRQMRMQGRFRPEPAGKKTMNIFKMQM